MISPVFQMLEDLGIWPIGQAEKRCLAEQADLEHLENFFGFPFPLLYGKCVLHFGTSSFNDGVAFSTPPNWNEQTDEASNGVRVFYGIERDSSSEEFSTWDLGSEIRSARLDGLPAYFLPICESDGLATVVYISCREPNYGHIYALTRIQIWNKMNGMISTQQLADSAFHIADSFEDFVQRLLVTPTDM